MLPDIKFFSTDVISGRANKVGDIFEALFMGGVYVFKVTEMINGDCFFANEV